MVGFGVTHRSLLAPVFLGKGAATLWLFNLAMLLDVLDVADQSHISYFARRSKSLTKCLLLPPCALCVNPPSGLPSASC
jgi:hypothetical protein